MVDAGFHSGPQRLELLLELVVLRPELFNARGELSQLLLKSAQSTVDICSIDASLLTDRRGRRQRHDDGNDAATNWVQRALPLSVMLKVHSTRTMAAGSISSQTRLPSSKTALGPVDTRTG